MVGVFFSMKEIPHFKNTQNNAVRFPFVKGNRGSKFKVRYRLEGYSNSSIERKKEP
ncbi:hypothetical protein RV13_GL000782 [Enterococcus raffinosus]|nr:hypothetical protein RV13_GL000782 [Enterococcus raffinosus]